MFYRTIQYELTDNGFLLVSFEPSEYEGPSELCKKGDKEKKVGAKQEALAGTDTAYANKEQGIQDASRSADTGFIDSLIPGGTGSGSTPVGGMSPYASAQYSNDVENIANTYQNLRQAGFRALGARGFGNAPTGMTTSMTNNLLDQQGRALTTAYRSGLDRTLNTGLEASNMLENRQRIYDPTKDYAGANNALTGATGSYKAGDAAASEAWKTGIGAATGLASAFIPGGQLAGGFAKLLNYGQPKQPSGLGPTYGGFSGASGGDGTNSG